MAIFTLLKFPTKAQRAKRQRAKAFASSLPLHTAKTRAADKELVSIAKAYLTAAE